MPPVYCASKQRRFSKNRKQKYLKKERKENTKIAARLNSNLTKLSQFRTRIISTEINKFLLKMKFNHVVFKLLYRRAHDFNTQIMIVAIFLDIISLRSCFHYKYVRFQCDRLAFISNCARENKALESDLCVGILFVILIYPER